MQETRRLGYGILWCFLLLSGLVDGASRLAQLKDVVLDEETETQCLMYRDGKWRNRACGISCNCPRVYDFTPEFEFAFTPFSLGTQGSLTIASTLATYEVQTLDASRYIHWRISGDLSYENLIGQYGSPSNILKINVAGLPAMEMPFETAVGLGSLLPVGRNETANYGPRPIHVKALDQETLQFELETQFNPMILGAVESYTFYADGVYQSETL